MLEFGRKSPVNGRGRDAPATRLLVELLWAWRGVVLLPQGAAKPRSSTNNTLHNGGVQVAHGAGPMSRHFFSPYDPEIPGWFHPALKKTTLQGTCFCGKIPKRNLVSVSKTSWNGDFYLQFEVKTRFFCQVSVEETNIPIDSLERPPIVLWKCLLVCSSLMDLCVMATSSSTGVISHPFSTQSIFYHYSLSHRYPSVPSWDTI
jgi:hypothetical protein